jgi:hypothetical protein
MVEQPKKRPCGIGLLAHVSASRGVPHKSPLNVPQFAIQAGIKESDYQLFGSSQRPLRALKSTCTPSPKPAAYTASKALR